MLKYIQISQPKFIVVQCACMVRSWLPWSKNHAIRTMRHMWALLLLTYQKISGLTQELFSTFWAFYPNTVSTWNRYHSIQKYFGIYQGGGGKSCNTVPLERLECDLFSIGLVYIFIESWQQIFCRFLIIRNFPMKPCEFNIHYTVYQVKYMLYMYSIWNKKWQMFSKLKSCLCHGVYLVLGLALFSYHGI